MLQEISAVSTAKDKVRLSEISFKQLEVSNRVAIMGLLGRLHIGEIEVMVGAIEKGISLVVLDENLARNKAMQFGLEVTGTLGILLRAKKLGLIKDIGTEIMRLKNAGMYLSSEIVERLCIL